MVGLMQPDSLDKDQPVIAQGCRVLPSRAFVAPKHEVLVSRHDRT